jgi:hypothetical protein
VHQRVQHPFQRERLRYDASLYMEMSYCYENGIPHSEFLDWTPEDRAKTLAFMMEKALRCDLCGTAEWEWDADRHMAGEGPGDMPGTSIVMEPARTQKTAQRLARMRREAYRHG